MAGRIIDVTMQLIDKVTQPLQGVTASLANSNKEWQRAGKDITKTGQSITKVGQGLTTAITLPVVAAGTAAVNNFAEVNKSLALIEQTMGKDKFAAGDLEGALMDAAQNSVFGMSDAADAALNYARAGFDAKEASDLVAPSFALAAGTATDLGTVTEGLGSTMKLFGANTSEASYYADVFAQAQAQANTTVGDLFESVSAAGSTFATVGWGVNDLAVATGVLGDAMVSGSEAGNGLKSGLANLSSNDAAIAMLEKLGVEVINDKGKFESFTTVQKRLHDAFADLTQEEQINAATALFGKNQMSKWMTIIQRSPDDIQGMVGALENVDGASQSMADALMSGTGGAIESLKSSIDVLSYSFGQFAAEYATPVIKKITEIVDWFVKLDNGTKDQIVRWAGIAAAVGPALLVFGKVVTTIGGVVTAVGKIGGAIKAAGGVMAALTGPGAIVVAVLAAIGIAIALVVTHWDQVKAAALAFWDSVQPIVQHLQEKWQELAQSFTQMWTEHIQPAWNNFSKKVSEVWTLVQPILQRFGEFAKDVFEVKFKLAIDVASEVFNLFASTAGTIVETLLGVFSGIIDFVVGVFTGDWERAWDGVVSAFSSIIGGLSDIASHIVESVTGILKGIADYVSGLFDSIGKLGKASQDASNAAVGQNAGGTSFWRGGPTWINERGAEIIDLPKGTRIYPHSESLKMAYNEGRQVGSGRGGNISINIPKLADSITVRSSEDIEAIASAIANKLEQTAQNLGGGELGYIY